MLNLALLAITKWLIENNYSAHYLCLFFAHTNSEINNIVSVKMNGL